MSAKTNTVGVKGTEFPSADLAIQHTYADGRGEAVMVGGRYFVVEKAEAQRLEAMGVSFAYLHLHDGADGKTVVVTVPVN